MLVISRRPGERVRLTLPDGEHVWIIWRWRSDHPDHIQLGIDAPNYVTIEREELIPAQPP